VDITLQVKNTKEQVLILPEVNTLQPRTRLRHIAVLEAGTVNPRALHSPYHPSMPYRLNTKQKTGIHVMRNRLRKRALTCIAQDSGTLILFVTRFQIFPVIRAQSNNFQIFPVIRAQSNKLGRLRDLKSRGSSASKAT
jgi:hypothetical protein